MPDTQAHNPQVDSDIRTVVGGNFSSDALGIPRYQGIVERVRAAPDVYLDRFESLFLGPDFDADKHSRIHAPGLLRLVADRCPDRVRRDAATLLDRYGSVPTAVAGASKAVGANMLERLEQRRHQLRILAR
jgi:hypothetical protein